MEKYFVPKIDTPLEGVVTVPGSKSMTNRALLLATLSEEESVLRGVLFSDDSRHFLACLQSLGFLLEIDENEKVVKIKGTGGRIPYKTGTIDVGSAGTAARFLTAMLALSDGEYTVMARFMCSFWAKALCRFAVPIFLCISGFFFVGTEYSVEKTLNKLKHILKLLLASGAF